MTQHTAFIDKDQIKIIDCNGLEYECEIANNSRAEKDLSYTLEFSAFVFVICFMFAISPFYFELLSNIQAVIFAFLAIASLSLMFICGKKLYHIRKYLQKITQEYNLAKQDLQVELTHLHKQVAQCSV